MLERLHQMLVKEFIQVFRDPRTKLVIFVIPTIQLLIFGYAVNFDVRHIATAVHDLDQSRASRELTDRFSRSGYFDVVAQVDSDAAVRDLLDRGRVGAVLRIRHGFDADLRAGRTAEVQLLLDGSDANTAGIVLSYAGAIANAYAEALMNAQWDRLRGGTPPPGRVVLQSRAWFNENLESRPYYVPGVIASLVTLMSLLLTSMSVVREKEMGTMEQLMVTPIRPVEFILGKTAPFALISFFDVLLITGVGVLWFHIPIRGSLGWLFLGTSLHLMTTLGIGLFISTVSATQLQAMMTTFFFFLPAMLLSGFMFPIANMPPVIQAITTLNPLRHFLVIIRSVFLKGVGIAILWPQMLALLGLGTIVLTFAVRRFRKTLA